MEAMYRMMNLADSVLPAPLFESEVELIELIQGAPPLPGDDNSLTSAILCHRRVSILGDGEEMRLQFSSFLATVRLDDFRSIQGNALERVDGY